MSPSWQCCRAYRCFLNILEQRRSRKDEVMLNGDEPATSSLLYLLSTRGTQCNLSSRSLLADHKRWNSFLCFSLKSEPRKHYLSSLPVREHTLQLVFKLQLIFTLLAKTHNVQLIYSNLSPACSPRNVQCKLPAPFSTRRQQCNISLINTMQPAFYLRSER